MQELEPDLARRRSATEPPKQPAAAAGEHPEPNHGVVAAFNRVVRRVRTRAPSPDPPQRTPGRGTPVRVLPQGEELLKPLTSVPVRPAENHPRPQPHGRAWTRKLQWKPSRCSSPPRANAPQEQQQGAVMAVDANCCCCRPRSDPSQAQASAHDSVPRRPGPPLAALAPSPQPAPSL